MSANSGGDGKARLLIVRFPDGSREFRYPDRVPEEGGAIWHDGERYRIVSIDMDSDPPSLVVEADSSLGDLLQSEEGAIRLEPILSTSASS
jgi:hypothetical protein